MLIHTENINKCSKMSRKKLRKILWNTYKVPRNTQQTSRKLKYFNELCLSSVITFQVLELVNLIVYLYNSGMSDATLLPQKYET